MSDADYNAPAPAKAGTYADLARRMDRMEGRQENFDDRLSSLAQSVSRIESNVEHSVELSKLRFDSLDSAIKLQADSGHRLDGKLGVFIDRMDSLISGETQTTQGRALMQDYQDWRKEVNARLPAPDEVVEYRQWRDTVEAQIAAHTQFVTQGKLLARLMVVLVGGNALAIAVAVVAALNATAHP